jgi:hypothetical protein
MTETDDCDTVTRHDATLRTCVQPLVEASNCSNIGHDASLSSWNMLKRTTSLRTLAIGYNNNC